MIDLKGKSAIVTGASSGIGRGIAKVLAREGCRLLITCRSNVSGLEEVVAECKEFSPEVVPFQSDIGKIPDIDALAAAAREKLGRVDILVNNAGITSKYEFLKITEDEFDNIFNINCRGTYFCAQRISRIMVEQKRGKIINISSLSVRASTEHFSAYASTKAAINKFTEVIALELAPYNIQVNSISAGWIPVGDELSMSSQKQERALYHIPIGRFGTPEDIGELTAFLASDNSDYITGQTIFADGGQSSLLSMPSRIRDRDFFGLS